MHELSITQRILTIALEKASQAEASHVSRINLVIGDLTGIVEEFVKFYFDFASKETIAAQASLSFHHPPTQLRCRKCETVFSPEKLDWVCPSCQEQSVEIISGRECYVESIEVE